MVILAIGLNYRTAPVEVRERFSVSDQVLNGALHQLAMSDSLAETVLVSTCNRTEVYVVTDQVEAAKATIFNFLADASGIDREVFLPYLYIYSMDDAVRHLFRVACGLDSMVLGETQILGQVRDAFLRAQESGVTGPIFNNLFKRTVTLAKQAHSETEIGRHAVSVSYAAVELAKKIFEELNNKTVLIVGAGEMSELTAKHLYASGARRVLVVNRTFERAKELADKFEGHALELKSIDLALKEADIVISSTGAEGYVISKLQVSNAMKQRRYRPLFLIDIAVPRDLDPSINKLENVFLYDIDDLQGVIAANFAERKKEAAKIEGFLELELVAFKQWQTERAAIPLISALQKKAGGIRQEIMESLQNKLPNLSERELKQLEKHTSSIVNQMLREPIQQLKEMAKEPQAEQYLSLFSRIFGIPSVTDSARRVEAAGRTGEPASDRTRESANEPVSESADKTGRSQPVVRHSAAVPHTAVFDDGGRSDHADGQKVTVEAQWLGGLTR
ncbi:glutamyl-tRNA reductase [Effusibacillus dendaii]|uniref:Glutamyl-tRNA reductase n=1 Tax=Effusibacillus dendaii TaxID=2743772 RepID=A0A7I8D8B6_9BACL|nr:glutamyl-tRNA reductase [Effusibacillus dendaii]BCJ85046.1 glutamyl-tRNA reductase [Effusibacillus dendaii]